MSDKQATRPTSTAVMVSLLIGMSAINPISVNIIVPALTSIAANLNADFGTAQLALSCYLFATAVAQLVRRAIQVRRRKEIDTVVSPAEPPVEFRDRHQLDQRDTELRQFRQLALCRRAGAFRGERAEMQLVDNLSAQLHTAPA